MKHLTRRTVLGGSLAAGLLAIGGNTMSSMSTGEYDIVLADMIRPLPDSPDNTELVRYATLAANGHNTQPWKFRAGSTGIDIFPDLSRRTPAVDPDNHHLYASLGCAAENLSLAARARGKSGQVAFFPEEEGHLHIDLMPGAVETPPLFDAIPHRQSVRALYNGRQVPGDVIARLEDAARIGGVEPILIFGAEHFKTFVELVVAGNSRQMDNPAFRAELKNWIRFNPRDAAKTRDGLFSAGSGNPILPSWLGSIMYDIAFTKDGENRRYVDQISSSAGIIVFVAPADNPAGWVAAGRASQRFALQATAEGLKAAFINQPVEDLQARRDLQSFLGLGTRRPNLIMRFGYGPDMPKSLRRPPSSVILIE